MSAEKVSDGTEQPLPPGLDLLWGRRERGKKGPKPGLTLDAIVEAALKVADAEGLGAVSMARVAGELGFTTMSLYRYVNSKEELLQLLWNASATGVPAITGSDWRSRVESWATAQRDLLSQRRWVLDMPMSAPPAGPNSLAWLEQGMQAFEGTGLSDDEKLGVLGMVSLFTLGEARMAADGESAGAAGTPPLDFGSILRTLVDEATYPTLHRAAWSGEIDSDLSQDDPTGDPTFGFGLGLILDGVQAMIDRKAAPAPKRRSPKSR